MNDEQIKRLLEQCKTIPIKEELLDKIFKELNQNPNTEQAIDKMYDECLNILRQMDVDPDNLAEAVEKARKQ